jgi:hypothetical protein
VCIRIGYHGLSGYVRYLPVLTNSFLDVRPAPRYSFVSTSPRSYYVSQDFLIQWARMALSPKSKR